MELNVVKQTVVLTDACHCYRQLDIYDIFVNLSLYNTHLREIYYYYYYYYYYYFKDISTYR
jgi:hypothetical protein